MAASVEDEAPRTVRTVLVTILRDIVVYWKIFVLILTPVLVLPLPLLLPSQVTGYKMDGTCRELDGKTYNSLWSDVDLKLRKGSTTNRLAADECLPCSDSCGTSVLEEAKCGYALIVMAVYWITETLPLPVTALLPLFLFPFLEILPGKEVASLYIADTSIVFLGGLMMALAIEKCNLHRRIGLGILVLVGSTPTRILIGFMLPTWFLSMWISNTATTAMMIPVAEAVIGQLREGIRQKRQKLPARKDSIFQLEETNMTQKTGACNEAYMADDDAEMTYFGADSEYLSPRNLTNGTTNVGYLPKLSEQSPDNQQTVDFDNTSFVSAPIENPDRNEEKEVEEGEEDEDDETKDDERVRKVARMLCLAVAYSSNVGGTATLTGTATNLLVAESATEVWASHGLPAPLTYTTWLFFGFPHSVICLILTWAWLQFFFMGWRPFCFCCVEDKTPHNDAGIKQAVREEYNKLGEISFGEISSIIFLIILVVLWFTRDPGFAPGYASLFADGYVTDAVPAILISVILFVWPSRRPNWLCFRAPGEKATRVPALLDWSTVSTKLPWGPLFLLGGGFALAEACNVSGLTDVIAEQLSALEAVPPWAIALIITTMVSFITEITSNTAVISLVLPILNALATDLEINPLYLTLPAGMAASYAFMLPIATPPNAIVFSYGHLKIHNMASVGFTMNIFCILVVTLGINTWGMALFDLDTIPWTTTNQNDTTTFYSVT